MDLKTLGLYIHIPFCLSKCYYCDFYSLTSISVIPDFLKALFKEMELYYNRFDVFDPLAVPGSRSGLNRTPVFQSKDTGTLRVNPEPSTRAFRQAQGPEFNRGAQAEGQASAFRPRSQRVDTLYIGGGTPSLLSPKQLKDILTSVHKNFDLVSDSEITVETNPADLNQSSIESMRESGINRINIGVQSFDEKVLAFLSRRHSAKQAISAIEASRNAGFQNIGLDLIYGVPGQDMNSWLNTLRQAVAFSPEHLSCYQLTLGMETPLGIKFQAGEFLMPGEELQYEFFTKTSEFLEDA